MYEKILTRRERLVRAARDLVSLRRCLAMTRAERLARAALWFVIGAVLASAALGWQQRRYPAPVNLLAPVVEQGKGFTLFTFRFEHHGAESICRLVVYHEALTWSVSC